MRGIEKRGLHRPATSLGLGQVPIGNGNGNEYGGAGFTLIEILVVVAIISILAGLSMAGLQYARKRGNENAARVEIQMLGARIKSFENEYGDFPPSSLSDIKIQGNGLNDGNESLFAFLQTRKHGGRFAEDLKEDRWRNADGDRVAASDAKTLKQKIDWGRGENAELLEYVDLWGNPYVYIHSKDYGKKFRYQNEEGIFEVEAQKNPATGTYYAPTTFQLWSIGEDDLNENGNGDDIVSWK